MKRKTVKPHIIARASGWQVKRDYRSRKPEEDRADRPDSTVVARRKLPLSHAYVDAMVGHLSLQQEPESSRMSKLKSLPPATPSPKDGEATRLGKLKEALLTSARTKLQSTPSLASIPTPPAKDCTAPRITRSGASQLL